MRRPRNARGRKLFAVFVAGRQLSSLPAKARSADEKSPEKMPTEARARTDRADVVTCSPRAKGSGSATDTEFVDSVSPA